MRGTPWAAREFTGQPSGADAVAVVALITLLPVVLIPVSIAYDFLLARHVVPRLARLPMRLALFILRIWTALSGWGGDSSPNWATVIAGPLTSPKESIRTFSHVGTTSASI